MTQTKDPSPASGWVDTNPTLKECLLLSCFFNPREPETPHPVTRHTARMKAQAKIRPIGAKISPGTTYNSISKMIKFNLIQQEPSTTAPDETSKLYMPKSNQHIFEKALSQRFSRLIKYNHLEAAVCLNLIIEYIFGEKLATILELSKVNLIKINHQRELKIEQSSPRDASKLAPEIMLLSSGEYLSESIAHYLARIS